MVTVHATCIAYDGHGILLRGPSGSGKSDLALRAIAAGARLVADDQVVLVREGDAVIGSAPPALHGTIEIRGLGLLRVEAVETARVALLVDMVTEVERMPELRRCDIEGVAIPHFALDPFQSSATVKLRYALAVALDPGMLRL